MFEHTALHCTSPKRTEWAKVASLRFVLEGLSHTTPLWCTALVCGKIHCNRLRRSGRLDRRLDRRFDRCFDSSDSQSRQQGRLWVGLPKFVFQKTVKVRFLPTRSSMIAKGHLPAVVAKGVDLVGEELLLLRCLLCRAKYLHDDGLRKRSARITDVDRRASLQRLLAVQGVVQ